MFPIFAFLLRFKEQGMLNRFHLQHKLAFFTSGRFLLALVIFLSLSASIQSLVSGTKTYQEGGREYNRYNNYTMFEKSFHHLQEGKDLYLLYPGEFWDQYKYTPTFTAFFGLFAIFPDWLGLSLWNLLNAMALFFAIWLLPVRSQRQKGLMVLIIVIELMTAIQNEQSNPLMAGLMLLSFGMLERGRCFPATLFILFAAFIKPFALAGMVIFLFYPGKWKMALYSALSFIILISLPLLFISLNQYGFLLTSYLHALQEDQSVQLGMSVAGLLQSWFRADIPKNLVLMSGVILFFLPFLRYRLYNSFDFRYLTLASILIWVVIFNYRAESPTYIIAMTGVAMWFVPAAGNRLNVVLFVLAFILTVLSPTDLFPAVLRRSFVVPYVLKALPCILIWFRIYYELFRMKALTLCLNP